MNKLRMAGLMVALGMGLAPVMATAGTPVDILVPAYFYPGVDGNGNGQDDWKDMAGAAGRVGITAIMNPQSGSGSEINQDYVTAVNTLRHNGGVVIGYLSTSQGKRPMEDLKQEIKNYIEWYGVDGFFFDEMPTSYTMGQLNLTQKREVYRFYGKLFDYVNEFEDHSYVIGNPGNLTEERFLNLPAADALVTLENDVSKQSVIDPPPSGALPYEPASWQTSDSHDPTEFGLIHHNVSTAAEMETIVNASIGKNFGLLYVTDDTNVDYNPFDRLPIYWDAFVQKVESEN